MLFIQIASCLVTLFLGMNKIYCFKITFCPLRWLLCVMHEYNALLFVCRVVMLVLSSGYIGLRIVALEEQLTTLGALPEFTLHSGYDELRRCFLLH